MPVPVNRTRYDSVDPVVLDVRVVCGTGGGPDKTILNSPRFLEPMKYRNLCAYLHPPDDPGFESLLMRADVWKAPVVSIPDRGPLDWRVVKRLLEVCRRERVTIWHGHDYKSNAIGVILQKLWPMKLVTTVHGWVKRTYKTPFYYAIDRASLKHYEAVLCVSDDLLTSCLKSGVRPERCCQIQNAIDIQQYSRTLNRAEAKACFGVPESRAVIGAMGRLSEEKGFDRLIVAFERLLFLGVDVELWIIGEGDQYQRLLSLARAKGCEDRVRLLGYQSQTIPLYEAMDVFVLSSLREGLPNVVLEAMAMEVPVVCTRVAGLPRLIQDGTNGILVQPDSISEITEALALLFNDLRLRTRLASAGRATIVASHSFQARMRNVSAVYDRLLGRESSESFANRED